MAKQCSPSCKNIEPTSFYVLNAREYGKCVGIQSVSIRRNICEWRKDNGSLRICERSFYYVYVVQPKDVLIT